MWLTASNSGREDISLALIMTAGREFLTVSFLKKEDIQLPLKSSEQVDLLYLDSWWESLTAKCSATHSTFKDYPAL